MQALRADNVWEDFGYFWITKEFLTVLTVNVRSTINPFLLENILCIGKNCNLGHFYMRKYVNLRTFFNPENLRVDKNQLFLCLFTTEPQEKNQNSMSAHLTSHNSISHGGRLIHIP